jgi:hypothetical protein
MLSTEIFNRKLNIALTEDLESKMQSLKKQTAKLMRPKNRRATPEEIARFLSPLHRYASRAGIEPEPENIIRTLAQYDPTERRASFMPWIIRTTGLGGVNLPEDGHSFRAFLEKFIRAKRSRTYRGPKDIMQFKTFADLRDEMANFNEEGAGELESMSKRAVDSWAEKQRQELLDDEMYTVYMFDPRRYTEEVEVVATGEKTRQSDGLVYPINFKLRAHASEKQIRWAELKQEEVNNQAYSDQKLYAGLINPIAISVMDSSINAPGSVWCTAGAGYAKSYLKSGPMYMFFKTMVEKDIYLDTDKELMGEKTAYMLADYTFNNFQNRANDQISSVGPMFFFFLCNMIVRADKGEFEQFGRRALNKIMDLAKSHETRYFQKLVKGEHQLPPEPAEIMKQAITIQVETGAKGLA